MNPELTIPQMEAENVSRLVCLNVSVNPGLRDDWERRLCDTWGAGERQEWVVGICKGCAKSIDADTVKLDCGMGPALEIPVTVCDDCNKLAAEHYSPNANKTKTVQITPKWDEECPVRFKELINGGAYPPNFDQAAFSRVCEWQGGSAKGLALIGASTAGKTTSLWALFRKIEREGGNPVFLTGVELARILSKAAKDLERAEWLWNASVLMIDDLGKERCTPAAAALLWELLDRRYQNKRSFICSTRFTGQELKDRFGEVQLGGDIVRRLNELCSRVEFKVQA